MAASPPPTLPRQLRVLLDQDVGDNDNNNISGSNSSSSSTRSNGIRRLKIIASTAADIKHAILLLEKREDGREDEEEDIRELEWYDPLKETFSPLPNDLTTLPSLVRLRWNRPQHSFSSSSSSSPLLALPGRRFPVDLRAEGFPILDKRLIVIGQPNSGQGTGHTTWDGAVVLAKYLEKRWRQEREEKGEEEEKEDGEEGEGTSSRVYGRRVTPLERRRERQGVSLTAIKGRKVVELGAGTGVVGLACAAMGAREVILTDLPYALDNLRGNVRRNERVWREGGREGGQVHACDVRVEEGDWFAPSPPSSQVTGVEVVVAADVVWLNELVEPLVKYLAVILQEGGREGGGKEEVAEEGEGGREEGVCEEGATGSSPSAAAVGSEKDVGKGGERGPVCYMSYQSRSSQTDSLLRATVEGEGLVMREIGEEEQEEGFRAPGVIYVYEIRARRSREGRKGERGEEVPTDS